MGKQQPNGDLRGLVIPSRSFSAATYTATTQASPYAGPVVPDQVTGLSLHSSGTLDSATSAATGSVIELETLLGGNVGEATQRWCFTGESMRNWEPPLLMAGWEFVARSAVANRYRYPHAVRRASTGLVAVSVTFSGNEVRVYRQSKFGTWSSATVKDTGNATRSTLVELPSGRLVCIYTYQVGASRTQLQTAYSDDDGATWATSATAGLESGIEAVSSEVLRIRAAYLNGLIVLFTWVQTGGADAIYQYVSADGGSQWTPVETSFAADAAYPDVCVSNGVIYVGLLRYDASWTPPIRPYVYRLTSAGQALSSATGYDASGTGATLEQPATYSGGVFTDGELALCATDDGYLWTYTTEFGYGAYTGTRETMVRVSSDGGETWYDNHLSSHTYTAGQNIAYSGSQATALRDLCAVPERGRVILFHSPQTNPGGVATNFTSLCAAYLGGWTSVALASPHGKRWEIGGWDWTYVPTDLPADNGATWTRTLTGAATEAIGSDGLTINAAALDTIFYSTTPVTTGYEGSGILSEFHVKVTAGSVRAELRISDGTNDFTARLIISTAQIGLVDSNAGTTIATLAIDCTVGVVLRFALDKSSAGGWGTNVGRVRAWAREDGPYSGALISHGPRQDRLWTQIGTSATLQSGVLTTNLLRFGKTVGGAVGTATCRGIFWSAGQTTAGNIADIGAPTDRGAIVTAAGSPMHLTQGYRVAGVDGPTMGGDTFTTQASYEYPASAINPFVSPSPRRRWRSTQDAAAQDITISGLDLGAFSGDLWACYVAGANWRTATLYRDTGAVNKLCDLDLAHGLTSLPFTRSRGLLYPSTVGGASTSSIYFPEASLIGAHVDFGGGRVRKVKTNTSGAWTNSATKTYLSTRVELESYDAGDPASGTLTLRMPAGLFLFEGMAATDVLMLRIAAQDTTEDYLELGTLLVGKVRVLRQYSRGRSLGFVPAYEVTETRSGARQVRRLGPTRRTVEIAWDDGVDQSQLYQLPTEPDYFTLGYAGAPALAAPADTALSVAGIVTETDGATTPVVYVPAIPQQNAAPGTNGIRLLNPEASLYGRILVDTLRLDADAGVMGSELAAPGEVLQVGSVRIEQEV